MPALGRIWLVARREIDESRRAKSFVLSTAILVLAVIAAVVIPALVSHSRRAQRLGVVGPAPAGLAQAATTAGRVGGVKVRIVPEPSLAEATASLRTGSIDAALIGGTEILIKQRPLSGTSSSVSLADALSQILGLERLLAQLPPAVAARAARGVGIPVSSIEPRPRNLTSRFTGFGAVLLIYLALLFYGIRLGQSVAEEKTSRVVEVLLATARTPELLGGKILGLGVVAAMQIVAALVAFVVAGLAVGSSAIHHGAPGIAAIGALWLMLGYALYAPALVAGASMIGRAADLTNTTMPLLIPLIATYAITSGVIFTNTPPAFFRVLAFVPPTAPAAMPAMYAMGAAPLWQVAISALLTILAVVGCMRASEVVYRGSVMRAGGRVRLRQVLESEAGPRRRRAFRRSPRGNA